MNANIPTATVIKAASIIKKIAYAIAAIGTIASYGTQVSLLLDYSVGSFSYIIPATIDLLAICAAMALQLPGLDIVSRKIAGAILVTAVLVSISANVYGAHNGVAAIAHAWPVVAYLLAELIANRVRAFADRLQIVTDAPAPIVHHHVTHTAPRARRATSHAGCTHAATARDRAVCRTNR